MADDIPITAGSGTNVATDDCSGRHVQLFKLAISADGSATLIPADATNGLDVDVTRVSGTVAVGDGTNAISIITSTSDGASDAQNAMRVLSRLAIFNGTTWDRLRGDTTNGVWVNVKADANKAAASTMNASSSDGATALTSTAQVIKASAGTLHGYFIYNPNATAAYVQFYNTAQASVTVGTTNPLFMLAVPAGSAANLWMPEGINFSNAGWSWAATSTAGGNGAPTTALDAVCWYK
jgi:hypothetical protein